MEHHHFSLSCSCSRTVSHYQRVNLHCPMVFLWFSYGFLMISHYQRVYNQDYAYPVGLLV